MLLLALSVSAMVLAHRRDDVSIQPYKKNTKLSVLTQLIQATYLGLHPEGHLDHMTAINHFIEFNAVGKLRDQ
jgi:hypothetical protein